MLMRLLLNILDMTGTKNTVIEGLEKIRSSTGVDPQAVLSELSQYSVVINNRSTMRAGACRYNVKEIEIHRKLLVTGREKQRNSTLLHEVAHAITRKVFGIRAKSHGREWKYVMYCLGQPANRCHNYDFLAEGRKPNLIYACQSQKNIAPKVIVDNFNKKQVPFFDATGAHAGALLGDVLHDPFQSGGLGTPANQRVVAGMIHKSSLSLCRPGPGTRLFGNADLPIASRV